MRAYVAKDAGSVVESMMPPDGFLDSIVRYDAQKQGIPIGKMRERFKAAVKVRRDIFRDCMFRYVPVERYSELSSVPKGSFTKMIYIYGMSDDERVHFQGKYSCINRLFRVEAKGVETRYLLIEECRYHEGGKWVERMAVFTPKEGSVELMQCAIEKMKALSGF